MDLMGQKIRDDGESAIGSFRKTHQKAIVINTGQLGIILSSLGSI
jgi:hypothetical protein